MAAFLLADLMYCLHRLTWAKSVVSKLQQPARGKPPAQLAPGCFWDLQRLPPGPSLTDALGAGIKQQEPRRSLAFFDSESESDGDADLVQGGSCSSDLSLHGLACT